MYWTYFDNEYFAYLGSALAYLALGIEAIMLAFHVTGILFAKLFMYRKPTNELQEELPGISILKPLVGADPNLQDNLETFFNIAYPKYELLICVHEEKDPAVKIVEPLMERYPHVDARLFLGGNNMKIGGNPKLNNLLPGYQAAKYDFVLISDSGIRTGKDDLSEMVSKMKPNVGMVHGLPFVTERKGFAAILDKVYFGGAHARMYITMNVVGIICVSGMSNLIRKSILDDAGGLQEFAKYISEDYYMGIACARRWTMVRVATVPSTIIAEPMTECFVLGLFVSWAISYLTSWDPIVCFMVHVIQWFILDYLQLKALQREPLNFSKVDYTLAWMYRECLTPFFFLEGLFSRTVRWRTGTFKLHWGGYLEEVR
ncbi:putative ceramide glucosyltransferase-B [Apostichopus japonicus]|uniref:ceramide glucosyltransferase n=1 Tax=Stichopus japonicus TaxID=307972 RepID=A0A2G8KUP2_STIJA|nr:putative ceramide glucosyltransferase-B [Apostichopus japonicus]